MTFEMQQIYALLESKLAEARQDLGRARAALAAAEAGSLERWQRGGDRDRAIRELERASALAEQVSDALDRIRDGGYGKCTNCGRAIPAPRLRAIPWAELCVRCREERDSHDHMAGHAATPRLAWPEAS